MCQGLKCSGNCSECWDMGKKNSSVDKMQEVKSLIMINLGQKGRKELYKWLKNIVELEVKNP